MENKPKGLAKIWREIKRPFKQMQSQKQDLKDLHTRCLDAYYTRCLDAYYLEAFHYVNSIWETFGPKKDLLDYFDFTAHSPHAWRSYHHQFWLVYLSCLIEVGDTQKARNILEKYVTYKDLLDVERYLPVAKFALGNGFSNSEIEKSAFVYDKLSESRRNDLFKKVFENKTVAVVGNGPSEIGKDNGAEIDSHDMVVRFNNYRTAGFEKDYGTKTDVWARGSGGDDVADRKEKYQLITWEADYDHYQVKSDHLDILYRQVSDDECIYNFGFDNHLSLRQSSGVDFPTTGLVFIWEIFRKFRNFDNINFYGFNFCQEKFDTYATHYFNDRDEKKAKFYSLPHHLDKEAQFMLRLIGDVKCK